MYFTLLLVVPLIAATSVSAADAPDSATGTFRSQAVTMTVRSAIAFRGPSFVDKSEAVIVALSNARLNPEAIVDYVDRRRVLETRIRDSENRIVYFEFKPDGTYRGMSYYFAPGNGCGYCTGDVSATVRLTAGKLSGKVTDTEKERSFDIAFETPVMTDEHGAPLPEGGGEPGKVFLAYRAALLKGDRPALKATMSKDQQQYWDEMERGGKLGTWVHAMRNAHPAKSIEVVKGYASATKAVLLIAGESSAGNVVGEVLLLREDDGWRVDDEITEPAKQ